MVSVIMPVYNAKQYIRSAIDSILNQSFSDFELILVDDCGTDETMKIIKDHYDDKRIRFLHNDQNMGIAYSRNRGIDVALGEYIAFMDDDDIASLERFKLEVEFMQTHPDIDAVGGRYCSIDELGKVNDYSDDTLQNPLFIKACLMFFDPIGNGCMLFKRDTVIRNRIRFKDNCYGMEDYMFWVDFSQVGSISNIKDVVLYWRNIEGNETSRNIGEKRIQRAKKFAEIQKYAIRKNGFDISENDVEFLSAMLQEGRFDSIVSRQEIERLYSILVSMINQAKSKGMNNYNEIKIACRKQFSRRLEYSEVWNL